MRRLASVSVHAPAGHRLAELPSAHNIERSYLVRAEPGVLTLTLPRNEWQANQDTLRPGHILVVESPTAPPWAGRLRSTSETIDGFVTLGARDMMAELDDRVTGTERHFTESVGSGALFAAIVRDANRPDHSGVNPPAVQPAGPSLVDFQSGGQSALGDIHNLQEATDYEAWLDVVARPSGLEVTARWGYRQGEDLSHAMQLWEGQHFAEAAHLLDLPVGEVETFGGVDALASRPRAIATLDVAGARIVGARSATGGRVAVRHNALVRSETELARKSARDLSRAVSSAEQGSGTVIESTLTQRELLQLAPGNYVTVHLRTVLSGFIARVVRLTGVQPSEETGLRVLQWELALR